MRVPIADLLKEPGSHKTLPVQISLEPVEIKGESVQFGQPFTGEAEIWNVGDRMLVRAKAEGDATLSCSRCLTVFSARLHVSFEEEFVQGEPREEVEPTDEDRTLSFYQGEEIDLSDSLRENLLLELPMKPLCDAACAGLCPTCGANLNQGKCGCGETDRVDPRLAALQDLLRKPDSTS